MGNIKDYSICTFGSHSALQILDGARSEGFHTIVVCLKGKERPYLSYGVADEMIIINSMNEFDRVEKQLLEKNAILIPHASFIQYYGIDKLKKLKLMYYGTRGILDWESDRNIEREWLTASNLKLPKMYNTPEDIDGPVIIKFHGAGGGQDYFVASSPKDFHSHIEKYNITRKDYVIQEYIIGVPMYAHYFYSKVRDELEIMSFDKRYESNADSIGRIAAQDQLVFKRPTSYTIAGNIPIVVRESLLPEFFDMGDRVVKTSFEREKTGLFGPFCLEGIIDPDLNFIVFEISARIVAGTNPYVNGSPYTWLKYKKPMSTGRRIAMDIREAIENDQMDKILG